MCGLIGCVTGEGGHAPAGPTGCPPGRRCTGDSRPAVTVMVNHAGRGAGLLAPVPPPGGEPRRRPSPKGDNTTAGSLSAVRRLGPAPLMSGRRPGLAWRRPVLRPSAQADRGSGGPPPGCGAAVCAGAADRFSDVGRLVFAGGVGAQRRSSVVQALGACDGAGFNQLSPFSARCVVGCPFIPALHLHATATRC